ncbi:hypothetical protein PILCRDRAFT_15467 [Piloderma croceum F 1598]|uniref:Uncharacterized protein n=1 Tax=Piloderma croceum (strain F 1598) TaxID=765440 RepID=A0A0C3EZM0_PILCF|nr:hypothetical protein PILCRDRAFT_15467 [Piloderma croceum F 1598]
MDGGSKVGPTDTPVPEAKVPGMGHTIAQHPKEDLGAGATVKTANGEAKSGQRMYEEEQSRAQGMKANGVGVAQEQIYNIQQYGFDPSLLLTMVGYRKVNGNDSEVKKTGLMDKVRGVCDGLSDPIPQQHKDTAQSPQSWLTVPNRGIFPRKASRSIYLLRQEGIMIHF